VTWNTRSEGHWYPDTAINMLKTVKDTNVIPSAFEPEQNNKYKF